MIETWDEFHEGTDIAESKEYGRQYIELTRKYSDLFKSGRKPSWPRLSLIVSALLWLLAWEVIVWFLPVQPRLSIRTDNPETETSEFLAGFSADGKWLVSASDS